MRCPECNTEIQGKSIRCPQCGTPLTSSNDSERLQEERRDSQSNHKRSKEKDNSPRLGKGMVVFIIAGIVSLIGFGAFQMFFGDGNRITYTMIEPDSTLAEKSGPRFEVETIDTAKRDSIKKAEKIETENMLKSMRRTTVVETEEDNAEENSEANSQSANNDTPETKPSESGNSESTPATTPKPHIESIETE